MKHRQAKTVKDVLRWVTAAGRIAGEGHQFYRDLDSDVLNMIMDTKNEEDERMCIISDIMQIKCANSQWNPSVVNIASVKHCSKQMQHKRRVQRCRIYSMYRLWRTASLCAWRPVAGVDYRLRHLKASNVVHVQQLQHVLGVRVDLNDVHLDGRLLQRKQQELQLGH